MYGTSTIKRLKAKDILSAAKELMDDGKRVRITVTGNSMYPFLRDGKDSVELTHVNYENIRFGDILLVLQNDGVYIMHRLIRKRRNYFYLNGDAGRYREGPLYAEQIVAGVIRVWRKDKEIKCSNPLWRGLSFIWFLLLPFRKYLIRSYGMFSRIVKPIRSKWK